jgi:hypothetical protein
MELPTLDRLAKEAEKENRKKKVSWKVGFAWFALCLLIFIGDRVVHGSRGEQYHKQAQREFYAIAPLPSASAMFTTDHYSPWNSHKAYVYAGYKTDSPYSAIHDFYDHELVALGWHQVEDRPYPASGRDSGGRQVSYCKGELSAWLAYAGAIPDRGWNYALDVSWGVEKCK